MINKSHVPEDMRAAARWVVWRQQDTRKIPYSESGPADTTKPETWMSLDRAIGIAHDFNGLGFVLGNGFCGIDLDNCIEDDRVNKTATTLIEEFNSYAELSPGHGVHIIFRGKKNTDRCRGNLDGTDIEIYDSKRFFTFTGNNIWPVPAQLPERQKILNYLCEYLWGKPVSSTDIAPSEPTSADITELIKIARATNDEFARLWMGDDRKWPSASEADAAFFAHLAFWCGRDLSRMRSICEIAPRRREKWNRRQSGSTWLETELRNAITRCSNTYEPASKRTSTGGGGLLELEDWANTEPAPTKWYIDGAVPHGHCLFMTGEMKSCKTFLALDMCIALATQQPCLGWEVPESATSLIYSPEGAVGSVAKRLQRLCWGRNVDPRHAAEYVKLISRRNVLLTDPDDMSSLRRTIETWQPSIVVLDPLVNLHNGLRENDEEMKVVLHSIRELQMGGSTILVLHHLKKDYRESSPWHAIRGHSVMGGWADGMVAVSLTDYTDYNAPKRVQAHLKDAELTEPRGMVLVDTATRWCDSVPGIRLDVADLPQKGGGKDLSQEVSQLLGQNGAMKARDIAESIGASRSVVYRNLKRMEEDGAIWKQGNLYVLL